MATIWFFELLIEIENSRMTNENQTKNPIQGNEVVSGSATGNRTPI